MASPPLSSRLARQLLDEMPDGVVLVHEAEGRIESANAEALRQLGVHEEEFIGSSLRIDSEPHATFRQVLKEQSKEHLLRLCDRQGHTGQEEDAALLLRARRFTAVDDGAARTIITLREAPKLAHLLQERDRLMRMATVHQVLPAVLHELKNPLASVSIAVELLLEEQPDPELQRELHAILSEIRRMVISLDGLGQSGQDLRSERPAAADKALRDAAQILAHKAEEAGVRLDARIPDLPLVKLAPDALRTTAFNLLNNAIQACRSGDAIRLEARLISEGSVLEITVSDTGPGMTPEVKARCTETFFSTKSNGSGLGLPLCRGLAETVGGTLGIESTPGEGTTITIELPLSGSKAPGNATPARTLTRA